MSKKLDINNFDIAIIKKLYIIDNLSKKQVCEKLDITLCSLNYVLSYCNIHKTAADIKKLREKTCLDKYGVTNPSKSTGIKEKIKKSNQEKYGANSFTATEKGKEKIKKTKLEKYGDEKYNNFEKSRLTKALKYNNSAYNNRGKYKQTMLDKYNVDNSFKLNLTKNKILDELCKNKEYNPIFREYISDRAKSIELLKFKNYSYYELSKMFNCPYYTIQMWVTRLDLKDYIDYSFKAESSYEQELIEFLKSIGISKIERHNKIILDGQEIDIFLPDLNIGIEFNGNYWHSDLFKNKYYHFNKSKLADEKGIRLIHIYQYEWDDEKLKAKIKSLLTIACGKIKNKIYARECEIRQITNKEAEVLNDSNHLQGHRNAKITYGLFYKNKLVQLMSFSHHKKYEWEIIRGCPGSNNLVIGGVSKLFKYFIREYKPSSIFSYCDFNKFNGKSYEKLGMKFIGFTAPDMKYSVKSKVINRQPHKYQEIKSIIDFRILGAGSKKYLWTKEIN